MSVIWPVPNVLMWPYVACAVLWSVTHISHAAFSSALEVNS